MSPYLSLPYFSSLHFLIFIKRTIVLISVLSNQFTIREMGRSKSRFLVSYLPGQPFFVLFSLQDPEKQGLDMSQESLVLAQCK